ncbi:MAG: hypothetical protein DRP11_01565 [Candidatus Aenigmatarchaeota archaeon]|nr:MAG: hypothetical protein DRP11_01565 [Candidatus Aenigmarchaeota archaeon]
MIEDIIGRVIFDSRGEETILVEVKTSNGVFTGSAPSGKSRGKFEAVSLPAREALQILEEIKGNFIGLDENEFNILDELIAEIAGENFKNIGANLGFALSSAFMKASTEDEPWKYFEKPKFPVPVGNVMGGGAHGGGTDIQEFLSIPVNARTVREAIETNIRVWKKLREYLRVKGMLTGRNDEGAWVSRLDDFKTLELVSAVCEQEGARVGLDMAASQLYKTGRYVYLKLGKTFTPEEHIDFVEDLIKTYNLYYVEDPFHEEDFKGFSELTSRFKKEIRLICGDDLFVTNRKRLEKGVEKRAGNSIIIKPNQIGTLSLAIETVRYAMKNRYIPVISHRSGETNDYIISDVAVGIGIPFIKCGVAGGERIVKLNRLLELWDKSENPKMFGV